MSLARASAEALSSEGPFSAFDFFQPRVAQQELSAAIADAIEDGEKLVCEAGTGTGKTFAYLVPALLSGARVVVSTGTKNLQDQLFDRDLPMVRETLGVPAELALLKGRENYLCRHRLRLAQQGAAPPQADQLAEYAAFATRSTDGDLSVFAERENDPSRGLVTANAEQCLGRECQDFADCFAVRARSRAQAADVIVVNHHLLLADFSVKQSGFGAVLPDADVIIVDEAHRLPEVAARFFADRITARRVADLARDSLLEAGAHPGLLAVLQEPAAAIEQASRDLRLQLGTNRVDWADAPRAVREGVSELAEALHELFALLDAHADASRGMVQLAARAGELAELAEPDALGAEDTIAWLETQGRSWSLVQSPVEPAQSLESVYARSPAAWILTSATLSVGGHFEHFCRRAGLEDPQTLQVQPPFDYARQALLYVPEDIPEPRSPQYDDRLDREIERLLAVSQGNAFLLFTSHRQLQRVAAWLQKADFPLFVQGEAPRSELLREFRKTPGAVLLGAQSFWEGVDVPGDRLRLVVIDKLPFAPPDDPMRKARWQRLAAAGRSPFTVDQLPEAILGLKQGVGRLIRSEHDRGVLAICDSRLVWRGYGRAFIESLPPFGRTRDFAAVQAFFAPENA